MVPTRAALVRIVTSPTVKLFEEKKPTVGALFRLDARKLNFSLPIPLPEEQMSTTAPPTGSSANDPVMHPET